MKSKIKALIRYDLLGNGNKSDGTCYAMAGIPLLTVGPVATRFHTFIHAAGMFLILIPTVITLLLSFKKVYSARKESNKMEMENSEINEMLNCRCRSRVIVPLEEINDESLKALEYSRALSDDVTAFFLCRDICGLEKFKEEFSQLDTDIVLVTRNTSQLNATEQLLEFIESAEFSWMNGDVITVIIPASLVSKSWIKLSEQHRTLYSESDLKRHGRVVVMTIPSHVKQ